MLPRVLLVDDEMSVRVALSTMLKEHGFEVFTADSAARAMEILSSTLVQAVVTDLWMETDRAGMDVLTTAAQQNPRPVCILCSAHRLTGLGSGQLGFDAFLEKPTTSEELATIIRELLARNPAAVVGSY